MFKTDVLRKKLLLMSKSQFTLKLQQEQQELEISYNNELLDIAELCRANEQTETGTKLIQVKNNKKIDLSAFNFQQNAINSLKEELEQSQKAYNELLIVHNKNAIELEDFKRNVNLKVTEHFY